MVVVQVPSRMSDEEEALVRKLAELQEGRVADDKPLWERWLDMLQGNG